MITKNKRETLILETGSTLMTTACRSGSGPPREERDGDHEGSTGRADTFSAARIPGAIPGRQDPNREGHMKPKIN